jgi:cysteine synthase A
LFLYSLCNGWLHEGSTVVESSSGSTAVSEAYFARMLGLPFIAVMPRSTSPEKITQIAFYGGRSHLVDKASEVYSEAIALARQTGGHYMDQFTYAERATDWRGNNNIAQSMFQQMARERFPVPRWIVVGAGTGGTSATIGRFVRYQRHDTQVCVADPEGSVFGDYHRSGDASLTGPGSHIEGIGRQRVEASFIRTLVDRMLTVSNVDSVAAMQLLSELLGRKVGPSTGTNLVGMLTLACEMRKNGHQGSIVSLLCDAGERYLASYFLEAWVAEHMGDCAPARERLKQQLAGQA